MNGYRQLDSAAVVEAGEHYDLLDAQCAACCDLASPALTCCHRCAHMHFTPATLPRQGTLYSPTTVTRQLQGGCETRQVQRDSRLPRIGVTHITGRGPYGFDHGACCIHILGSVSA